MNDPKMLQRLYNIDFLRLLFVVLIVYYHLICKGYVHEEHVTLLAHAKKNALLIGDVGNMALFIVSGYFLFGSLEKRDKAFLQFSLHRLLRFWPTLCFAVLCMGVLGLFHLVEFDVGQNILNLFAITKSGTGLTLRLTNLHTSWFVCTLFWASLFYYALYSSVKTRNTFNLIVALIVWFSIVLFVNSIGISQRTVIYGFFSRNGMWALGMIGLGILLRAFLNEIKIGNRKINYCIASVLEVLLLFYLLNGCLISSFKESRMVLVIAFSALFVLFIMHQGFLSQFLNKPWVSKIGRYAFSIYIMQEVGLTFVKYLWLKIQGGGICLILVSVLICVMLGVVTYHLIEKPVSDFYRKKIEKVKV